MKQFSATINALIESSTPESCLLVALSSWGGATVRWANTDTSVTYDGDPYDARPFRVSNLSFGGGSGADGVTLTVANEDLAVSDLIDTSNPASLTSPASLLVYRVFLDDLSVSQTLVSGMQVVSYAVSERSVEFKCMGMGGLLDMRLPKRKYSKLCRHEFKGTECTYTASAVYCSATDIANGPHEYTPAACISLGNWDNYGGFIPVVPKRELM